MLLATNRGVGTNIGFPDVCNTPVGTATVPIPYPNFGFTAMATMFCAIVKVGMMHAFNLASQIGSTTGDEAGVAHPMIKQVGAYTAGNLKVFIEKLPGISFGCPSTGNGMNNGVGVCAVPSVSTVFYSLRTPQSGGEQTPAPLSAAGLQAIAGRTRRPTNKLPARLVDGIGIIKLPLFSRDLPAAMFNALRALGGPELAGLVLDLRGNPGGELPAMTQLAEDFLADGAVIVSVVDAEGDEIVYEARQPDPYRCPLAVLVDGQTASAAELFAGCLQAHGRAMVVGERTYGKSSAQAVVQRELAEPIYATVARCYLPGRISIEGVGVMPDHLVAASAGAGDAPLEAALQLLRAAR